VSCFLCLPLCLIFLCISQVANATTYFHSTGLMDIPTAYIMDNGIFDVGTHIAISDQKRQDMSLIMDFGLLNFAEIGIVGLKRNEKDYIMGNVKVLLAKESGAIPSFSVGVDNIGEDVDGNPKEYDMSLYAVLSKQFNLPFLHLISGHLGIGNKRYIDEDSIGKYLHGGFLGLSKELILDSRDIRLSLMGELKGKRADVGLKCLMKSGLAINLAIGQLSSDKDILSYHIGIAFTNAPMMKEIAQSIELAKQAVRIANEARSEIDNVQKVK
jgi:hypothetical protein